MPASTKTGYFPRHLVVSPSCATGQAVTVQDELKERPDRTTRSIWVQWQRAATPGCRTALGSAPLSISKNLNDLFQAPGPDIIDETPHTLLVWDERAGVDTRDRLTHVLLKVGKCVEG